MPSPSLLHQDLGQVTRVVRDVFEGFRRGNEQQYLERVQGLLRTLWSWVWIQTLYSLGVPARHLARWYQPVRENRPVEGREPGVKPRATRAALPSEK